MASFADLEKLEEEVTAKWGEGTFTLASNIPNATLIETGIFTLDYALCGGLPETQPYLFVGWEQAGKTTVSLRTMGNALRKYPDGAAVYADLEGSFDSYWSELNGVDVDRVYMISPESGEQAGDIMIAAIEAPSTKFLLLDSIPAMVPNRLLESSLSDQHMAILSQLVSRFYTQMITALSNRRKAGNPVTVIVINQYRSKVGVVFGDPRVIPGGNQQRFQSHGIIDFKQDSKAELEKDDLSGKDVEVTTHHHFKVVKFKGAKIRQGEFDLCKEASDLVDGSIDDYKTVIQYAKKHGLLAGGGSSWTVYGLDDQKFKNHDEIRNFLIQNPVEYTLLKARIIATRRLELGFPMLPPDNYLLMFHTDDLDLPDRSDAAKE